MLGLRLGLLVALAAMIGCADSKDDAPAGDGDGDGDAATEEDASTGEDSGPEACGGATREAQCLEFCELYCQNQTLFCLASECLPDDCSEGGDVYDACMACEDDACVDDLCEEQANATCETFGKRFDDEPVASFCFDRDPSCVLFPDDGCVDVCGTNEDVGGDLVDNGICEDGGEGSATSVCPRGTDCSDCGARACAMVGSPCDNHGDCCGYGVGPGALCVDADGDGAGTEPASCFAGCDEEHPCPPSFQCRPTSAADFEVCVRL